MTTTTKARPSKAQPPAPPRSPVFIRDLIRWLRRGWRRLTSMRTALVLLFLLALASVPGSLLPQKPLNPSKVQSYIASHGSYGRFLDSIGAYDVFGSPWFAAIYLLLGISLVGCLTPRIRIHFRAMRAKPLPAPKNLARLPESGEFSVSASAGDTAQTLKTALGWRWRTIVRSDEAGNVVVSAEKGYSRESGNLLFHIALLGVIVTVAIGHLWGFSASVVVQEGQGFSNQVLSYDSWKPGRFVNPSSLPPFLINNLDKFTANYLPGGEPSVFDAQVTYQRSLSSPEKTAKITVNNPLRLEGDRVYLIGHGFAPIIQVTTPSTTAGGKPIVHTDTVTFIPQNPTTFYSEGADEIRGAANADGVHTNDIGISGFFAPTAEETSAGVYTSIAPQATNPILGLFVYKGDVGNDGVPRSVYSLDATQISTGKLKKIGAVNLKLGQSQTLSGVSVKFVGYRQWASMQVSHDPSQDYLLIAAVAMVIGLIGSLGVRRRRLWIRIVPPVQGAVETPRTVVQVGGLARSDSGNFTDEFAGLVQRLRTSVDGTEPAPAPDEKG